MSVQGGIDLSLFPSLSHFCISFILIISYSYKQVSSFKLVIGYINGWDLVWSHGDILRGGGFLSVELEKWFFFSSTWCTNGKYVFIIPCRGERFSRLSWYNPETLNLFAQQILEPGANHVDPFSSSSRIGPGNRLIFFLFHFLVFLEMINLFFESTYSSTQNI